jgi:hypothetical protein
MDVISLTIAAVTFAVTVQAALVFAAIACMIFSAVPALVGWLAGRLIGPMMTPTR